MAEDAFAALASGTACIEKALDRFAAAYGSLPARVDAITNSESTATAPNGESVEKFHQAANCAAVGLLEARTSLENALQGLSITYQELGCAPSTWIYDEKYDGSNQHLWRDFRLSVEAYINSYWTTYAGLGQLHYFLCAIFAGKVLNYYLNFPIVNGAVITSATEAIRAVSPALDAIERLYGEDEQSSRLRFERAYNATYQGNATFQSFFADFLTNARGSGRLTTLPDSANPNPCLLGDLRNKTRKDLRVAVDKSRPFLIDDWDEYVSRCRRLDQFIKAPRSRQPHH